MSEGWPTKPAHRKVIRERLDKVFIERLSGLLEPLASPNGKYSARDILRAVLGAIQENDFVEGWTDEQRSRGRRIPSGDLVHLRLRALDMETVLKAFDIVNEDLLGMLERGGPRREVAPLAIDLHEMPYFGEYDGPHVVGIKKGRGTNLAYEFASVNVVAGRRRILYAMPVGQFDQKPRIIKELLERAKGHVTILAVYLDKGFYSVEDLIVLEGSGERYLMPVPMSEGLRSDMKACRPMSHVVGMGGNTFFKKMRTVKSGRNKIDVQTVYLYRPGESEDLAFVTNMEVSEKNVEVLAEGYRLRWGIETGYRMTEMVRGRTCSQSHAVRRLLHLLSVLLYNVWQLVDAMLVHELGARLMHWGYAIRMKTLMRLVLELVEMHSPEGGG